VFGIDRTPNSWHDQCVTTALASRDGVDELRDAAVLVGLNVPARRRGGAENVDLVLVNPSGGQLGVEVKRMSLASGDRLSRRLREWTSELADPSTVGVVVADRTTREARELLLKAGWGWFDLRSGHIHLVGPGLFVDADLPELQLPSDRPVPLSGRVGIEVAALMLLAPDEPAAVRRLASQIGRAPSSVSDALSGLREGGLLDEQRRPVVPDLFWELAQRWGSKQADVITVPGPGRGAVNDALGLALDDVADGVGWALSDTLAAVAYDAPISARSDHVPDFYVPDEATLRRAVQLLGAAHDHASRAATVKVAPVRIVCSRRVDATAWTRQEWPLAQPLFVALDLAQDPGRGREILEGWTPPDPWRRVW
jgi:hypothetical protein